MPRCAARLDRRAPRPRRERDVAAEDEPAPHDAPAQVARPVGEDRQRRRLTFTVAGGLAAVVALIVVFQMPWGPRMIDLAVYREGAGAILTGADVYRVSEPSTGLPFTYPVFAALVFVPFALLPVAVARIGITLASLAALLLICHVTLRRVLPGRRTGSALLLVSVPVAVAAVTSHPVLDTLIFGQVNLVLVAMVLTDVVVVRGRGRGVLVGLATGIKLTPGLFLCYYLVTGQRREARNAAVTAGLTVLAGLIVDPAAAWSFWTRYVFDPARTGGVTYAGNQSILAITARLLRVEHPPAAIVWGLSAGVIALALVLARRLHQCGEELGAVSVVAAAALLASPISWTHHWVWFIPCFGVVAAWVHRTGGGWRWFALGAAAVVLWSGPMRFTPKNDLRELHHTLPQQVVANSFGLLAAAFLAWAAALVWSSAGASVRAGSRSAHVDDRVGDTRVRSGADLVQAAGVTDGDGPAEAPGLVDAPGLADGVGSAAEMMSTTKRNAPAVSGLPVPDAP